MDNEMRQLMIRRSNILVCTSQNNGPEAAQRLQDELYDVDREIEALNRQQIARSADQRETRESAW
jgi:hypothetical protein